MNRSSEAEGRRETIARILETQQALLLELVAMIGDFADKPDLSAADRQQLHDLLSRRHLLARAKTSRDTGFPAMKPSEVDQALGATA